jgi:hypothetical protein
MDYCYKAWRDGSHEIALEKSFNGLERLNFIIDNDPRRDKVTTREFWQETRAYLLLSENFYMGYAYHYITTKLTEWGWVNRAAQSVNDSQSKVSDSANQSQSEEYPQDTYWNMHRNLAINYDDWDRALSALETYFQKYSTSIYLRSNAFEEFKASGALRDFGGYDYEKAFIDLEALDYKLSNSEKTWYGFILAYSNQWALFETEDSAIKILPINISDNGQIDMWLTDNNENISNLPEFLYKKNYDKMKSLPGSKKLSSKEIVILNSLASSIYFLYNKEGIAMLCYQILLCNPDRKQLCFIKYEEEKDKKSSVPIFETFVQSLRVESTKDEEEVKVSQEIQP